MAHVARIGNLDELQYQGCVFVRVFSPLIGSANREGAVEQSEPQSLDAGRTHLDPGEVPAGISLSHITGRMMGVRPKDFDPAQTFVNVGLWLPIRRVHEFHGEDILAVQCLLQRRPRNLKKSVVLIYMGRNRNSAGRSDCINHFDERLACDAIAMSRSSLILHRTAKGIKVRSGLRRIENCEHMNSTVYRDFHTGEKIEHAVIRMANRSQLLQGFLQLIDPRSSVVICHRNTIHTRTHMIQNPLFRRTPFQRFLVRSFSVIVRFRSMCMEIIFPPTSTGPVPFHAHTSPPVRVAAWSYHIMTTPSKTCFAGESARPRPWARRGREPYPLRTAPSVQPIS